VSFEGTWLVHFYMYSLMSLSTRGSQKDIPRWVLQWSTSGDEMAQTLVRKRERIQGPPSGMIWQRTG
jgi:hypothetical protein